jgi:hypothetical protein
MAKGDKRAATRRGGVVIAEADIPPQIGPAAFGQLGRSVTVRCPLEFAPLMRSAGGTWDPGGQRWLIHVRRIGSVIRTLRRETDPLFRNPT